MSILQKRIVVVENKEEFRYHLFNMGGNPYYIPDDPIVFEDGLNTQSGLILPISEKQMKMRLSKFIGFRLRFDSSEHTTVEFGIDPMKLSWTEIDIEFTVRRFVYKVDGDKKFHILDEKDPMIPPEHHLLVGPSALIGQAVLGFTHAKATEMATWILNNST